MSVVRCAKVSRDLVFVVSLVAAASVAAAEKVSVVALFKDNAMVVLGGRQRLLRKGQRSPEGVTLIQVDAKGATLEIAGKRKLYPLGRQISTQFKAASSSIPVRIWPTAAGMYNASETINGFPVSLHCRYRSRTQTASGVVNTYNVNLNKVRVGTIALKDVRASFSNGDHPKQMLLGNSF